ncbi:MAG: reactive intermediate/imine deaminase [Thalassobius sp.]|nr:reactive intermediate/imine deaminase [Thalassovita sp.]|tara:strand:- start:145 stop:525 length:381 start_codon:yes stop_codon:yes gene_type:complete
MKKIINTPKAGQPIGPYNQAVEVGNTLYISGQIAIDAANGGALVQTSLEDETNQVLKNLGYILEEAGYTFEDVVKSSIFLSDMNSFATVNEIYGSVFEKDYPARETVEVSKLPKGVNVEISMIAVK